MRRLQYGHDNQPREFAVQIHRQIVLSADDYPLLIPLQRQQYHAAQLTHLYPELYVQSTLQHVEELQEHFAWPEVLEIVAKAQKYWWYFSGEEQSLLNRINAKALRYTPKADAYVNVKAPNFQRISIVDSAPIDNQHASMQWLTLELDDQLGISHDLFPLLRELCSIGFVPPEEAIRNEWIFL